MPICERNGCTNDATNEIPWAQPINPENIHEGIAIIPEQVCQACYDWSTAPIPCLDYPCEDSTCCYGPDADAWRAENPILGPAA